MVWQRRDTARQALDLCPGRRVVRSPCGRFEDDDFQEAIEPTQDASASPSVVLPYPTHRFFSRGPVLFPEARCYFPRPGVISRGPVLFPGSLRQETNTVGERPQGRQFSNGLNRLLSQLPGPPGKLNWGRPPGRPGIPGGWGCPAAAGCSNRSARLKRNFE
jgi:hypothetical protein